jgi:MFS transporter, UMF1 family
MHTPPRASSASGPPPGGWPGPLARLGWILFDWSTQPFFTLVTTFIFAPYFATALAGDPAHGQALWSFATGIAGLAIALGAPVFSAIADSSGRRKPWIAAFGVLLVLGCGMLWWARPGADGAVALALAGLVVASIGAEFATVFNNAMMPSLAPPWRLGRLSGTGWAAGYAGGLVALGLTLAFLAASPETGRTLAGFLPAFGLDAASRGGDRATGPLSALWFVVFVTPLFLLTPDAPATGVRPRQAVRDGLAMLRDLLPVVRARPGLARYLVANMVYTDGLIALFAVGGIYGAGVFGWQTTEIGIFGILLLVAGTIGTPLGGRLDDRIGPRAVIAASLALLLAATLGIVGTTRDTVLFLVPVAPPVPGGGLYSGTAEKAFVGFGLLVGLAAGPLQSSSRTLLVRLSPPERIGQCFGLFALTGKVTSFLGPTLVGAVTAATGSQRAGASVLLAFFAVGLALVLRVSGGSGGAR